MIFTLKEHIKLSQRTTCQYRFQLVLYKLILVAGIQDRNHLTVQPRSFQSRQCAAIVHLPSLLAAKFDYLPRG